MLNINKKKRNIFQDKESLKDLQNLAYKIIKYQKWLNMDLLFKIKEQVKF